MCCFPSFRLWETSLLQWRRHDATCNRSPTHCKHVHTVRPSQSEVVILDLTSCDESFASTTTFGFWKSQDLDPGLFDDKSNSFPTGLHKCVGFEGILCLPVMFLSLCCSWWKLQKLLFPFEVTDTLRKCGRAVCLVGTCGGLSLQCRCSYLC